MNRKTLIVIIMILALILIAGLVVLFVLPSPSDADSLASTSQSAVEPDADDASADPTDNDTAPITETADSAVQETVNGGQASEGTTGSAQEGDPSSGDTEETEPEGPLFPDAPDVEVPETSEVTYMDYHGMSADEQKAFINTFESYDAFFDWLNAAKEEYENSQIEIDGSTPVNAEDIIGGN